MKRVERFDWVAIESALAQDGQAVLPALLSDAECNEPEGPFLADLRTTLYEKLVPVANGWNKTMGIRIRYPAMLQQRAPRPTVVRLGPGQEQPLSRSPGGDHVFPVQVTILLRQPGVDFTGGELVMTEQRPRMQSRPMVVPLARGDAAVFAVHHRPFCGSRGFYRVNLRHAVSRVRSGERVALDMVFHDALHQSQRLRTSRPYQGTLVEAHGCPPRT